MNNDTKAAQGTEIPPELWESIMQIVNPMAKEGYQTLYEGIYKEGKTNLYPDYPAGSTVKRAENPTDYREFPSEGYDSMTNPDNRNIIGYIMDGIIKGGGHTAHGRYKPGKKHRNSWGAIQSADPDTIMISDEAQTTIGTLIHELMHVETPTTGGIEHIDRYRRMGDDRNQKRFADIINNLFEDKKSSNSVRDMLELKMLKQYDSELRKVAK